MIIWKWNEYKQQDANIHNIFRFPFIKYDIWLFGSVVLVVAVAVGLAVNTVLTVSGPIYTIMWRCCSGPTEPLMLHDSWPIVSRCLSLDPLMFHVVSFYSPRTVHHSALPQESNATPGVDDDEDADYNDHAADRDEEDEKYILIFIYLFEISSVCWVGFGLLSVYSSWVPFQAIVFMPFNMNGNVVYVICDPSDKVTIRRYPKRASIRFGIEISSFEPRVRRKSFILRTYTINGRMASKKLIIYWPLGHSFVANGGWITRTETDYDDEDRRGEERKLDCNKWPKCFALLLAGTLHPPQFSKYSFARTGHTMLHILHENYPTSRYNFSI